MSGEYGWTANMERIMKSQVAGVNNPMNIMKPRQILEINPLHPIIQNLSSKLKTEGNSKSLKDLIFLLYDTTVLSSGFSLENPTTFSNRILKLISLGLDIQVEDKEDVLHQSETENTSSVDENESMEQVD